MASDPTTKAPKLLHLPPLPEVPAFGETEARKNFNIPPPPPPRRHPARDGDLPDKTELPGPPPPGVPVRGLVARKVPPGGDPPAGFARPPPPRNKFRPAPPSGPPPPGAYVMQRKPFDAATALDLPAPPEPLMRPPAGPPTDFMHTVSDATMKDIDVARKVAEEKAK